MGENSTNKKSMNIFLVLIFGSSSCSIDQKHPAASRRFRIRFEVKKGECPTSLRASNLLRVDRFGTLFLFFADSSQ